MPIFGSPSILELLKPGAWIGDVLTLSNERSGGELVYTLPRELYLSSVSKSMYALRSTGNALHFSLVGIPVSLPTGVHLLIPSHKTTVP